MKRVLLAAALLIAPAIALAQTANVSPTSPSGTSPGNVNRTPPSGSTTIPDAGRAQIGAPTPLERKEEQNSAKDAASVCKGC